MHTWIKKQIILLQSEDNFGTFDTILDDVTASIFLHHDTNLLQTLKERFKLIHW